MLTLPRLLKRASSAVSLAALALTIGVVAAGPASADDSLTYAGRQMSIDETLDIAYRAGFRSESQLLTITSIAMAESSLYTQLRHWHPELGYRDAGSSLGVQGPGWAYSGSGRQAHADRGIFQIGSRWWPSYTDAMADDPAQSARLAMQISRNATDFSPWDAYSSGDAQRSWDAAFNGWPALRPMVRQYLQRAGTASGSPVASGATTGIRHTLAAGDTLFKLAVRYYGNGDLWPRIATHNGITDPEKLQAGLVVRIP